MKKIRLIILLLLVCLTAISCTKSVKNYLVGKWSVTIPDENNLEKNGTESATGMVLGILVAASDGAQVELEFFESSAWGFIFINNGDKSTRIGGTYDLADKGKLTVISTEDGTYSTFYLIYDEKDKKVTFYTEAPKDKPAFVLDKL